MVTETQSVIAVSVAELREFGCPHCGYRSGYTPLSGGGAAVWTCGSEECGKTCCALAEGVTTSPIGFGDLHPELQVHPRRGIPSHGRPDKRPDGEGEFFQSRGFGLEWNLLCFCCGARDKEHRLEDPDQHGNGLLHNIAAFVQCKEAGERVVVMFSRGARLDYRDSEPDRVQVKIGACGTHLSNLQRLHELTKDGVITSTSINEARV